MTSSLEMTDMSVFLSVLSDKERQTDSLSLRVSVCLSSDCEVRQQHRGLLGLGVRSTLYGPQNMKELIH